MGHDFNHDINIQTKAPLAGIAALMGAGAGWAVCAAWQPESIIVGSLIGAGIGGAFGFTSRALAMLATLFFGVVFWIGWQGYLKQHPSATARSSAGSSAQSTDTRRVLFDRYNHQSEAAIAAGDYKALEAANRSLAAMAPEQSAMSALSRPFWAGVHYNLACALSMQQRADEALDELKISVGLGESDVSHMDKDTDLTFLRSHSPLGYSACKAQAQANADAKAQQTTSNDKTVLKAEPVN